MREAERIAEEEAREAERLLLEQEEEEQDRMKRTKFNFSGMSFAEYVKSIKETLNKEMNNIVTTFVKQKASRHHAVHLS